MPRVNAKALLYLAAGAVVLLVGLDSIRGDEGRSATLGSFGSAVGEAKDGAGLKLGAASKKLIVDVSGAVRRPGVYQFDQGSRVIDAIRRAGGARRGALVGAINRAATLSDGQQVVVPSSADGAAPASGASAETLPEAPISLGTATQADLEEIDGIGPVTAGKILEFRDSQGGLASVDELDQISGIGPVTMESLRAALAP